MARGAVDRAFESHIAETAVAAFGDHDDLAGCQQLVQHIVGFGVNHHGADRHFQNDVVTGRAEHVRTHTVFAPFSFVAARKTVVNERIQTGIGHGIYIAAATAVTAVGAAEFFVFFVPERDAAIPAVTGDDVNKGFVNKFHDSILNNKAPASGALQGVW